MASPIQKAQPGGLITAAFVNGLIDQLGALEGRIASLETLIPGNRMMQIFSPLPSDTYAMGTELRIVGQGFGLPALNTVTFDGVGRVSTFKAGSNDNLLILDIPTFPLPATGKVVTLAVSNNAGYAQARFTLLPPEPTIPTGQLFLTQTAAPTQQLVQPPGFDLYFTVSASVTLADTYVFSARFTNASSGWEAFLVGAGGNRLSPEFQIGANSKADVRVRVTVPTGATGSVQLAVNFASKSNPATVQPANSGLMTLTVGQPAPTPEKVGVIVRPVYDSQGNLIQPDADGVYALPVARAPASFFLMVTSPPGVGASAYTVAPSLDAGATGWPTLPEVVDPPSGKMASFQGQRQVQVNVRPQAGAQPTSLTVKVYLDSDPTGTYGHATLRIRAG